MNEELAARHSDALAATLGAPGRLISLSKSGYGERHPDHVAVFNANVCVAGGKLWWGDLDLTLDEGKLVQLAARIGETVYVLYEGDSRFEHEDEPLLGEALYSVTPSGHTKFAFDYLERARDGSLRRRPPEPDTRKRFVLTIARPRLLRFWKREIERQEYPAQGGRERTTLVYLGERTKRTGEKRRSPLLILGFFRRGLPKRWLGFELTWYPTPKPHAPRALVDRGASRRRGRIRPHAHLTLYPGLEHSLVAGVELWRWLR